MTSSSSARLFRLGATLFALAGVAPASAATFVVSSLAALQSQIDRAVAGDLIIVANGTYTTSAPINVNRVGTAAAPIIIAAESLGGVTIGGTHGFAFSSPAAFIELDGFRFVHANSINLPTGTSHLVLTRNFIDLNIAAGADVSYINISGDDIELDRNEFASKDTLGNMLDVTGANGQVARRLWVHHNYFHDFTPTGGNGAETIRWGLSGLSLSTGDGLCEHNLFVRCQGENELISNKSSGNTYRYNTFLDSPGAQFTLRHGNDCLAYGNYLRNTDGLRVFGDRHQIFSNHFDGNTKGVDMGNGDGEVADGALLTSHDRPDHVVVAFNTFVNNTTHYQMGGRTNGLGATNITFANNLIQGGGTAVSISTSAPYANPVWSANLLWNVTTIGDIPASGDTIVNPLLAADTNGVYHLQSGSPAIDNAAGTFTAVTVDQDGQPRPGTGRDQGADEVSTAAPTAGFLTPADVGPNSGLGGGTITVEPANRAVLPDGTATFIASAVGAVRDVSWQRNGHALPSATSATLSLPGVQPIDTGLITATFTAPDGLGATSQPAILGLLTNQLITGAGNQVLADTVHPNGNTFDQVLLTGAAVAVKPDAGQVLRLSFIDLNDDIVQVELSGAGTLSLVLDGPSGPAAPVNYHQPATRYLRGAAGLVIAGADETTNLTLATVGRLTAFDPTGGWDLAKPVSATNDPANNRNPLFRDDVAYDGIADLAFVAISSANGKFGGLRGADASFSATRGFTGIYAPGVGFQGPVFVGDIVAFDSATPVLQLGGAEDVRITGGDLAQANGRPVRVSGITQLRFAAGVTSHNTSLPARTNQARLEQDGVDVTARLVAGP